MRSSTGLVIINDGIVVYGAILISERLIEFILLHINRLTNYNGIPIGVKNLVAEGVQFINVHHVFKHEGVQILLVRKDIVVTTAWSSSTASACGTVKRGVQSQVLRDGPIPVERCQRLVVEVAAHAEFRFI